MTAYKKVRGRKVTTYGAYDAGLPCKNPSCKSHGMPHPNCRCYGNFAEGGDVSFCSEDRHHEPDCEYFADGGPVDVDSALEQLNAPPAPPEHQVVGALAGMGAHKLLDPKGHDTESFLRHAKRGHARIKEGVQSIFDGGGVGSLPEGDEVARGKLEKYMDQGAVSKTMQMAEDSPHLLAMTHPTESLMLNTSKGRVAQHLTNLRPQTNQPKLAFDDDPDDSEQKRTYQEALDIATSPLSVLDHIKAGTIEPSHLGHLQAMYPEIQDHLQKKVTEKITENQLSAQDPPPYHIRQGLSMLMGTPLSSEFTPVGIQTAQSAFAQTQTQTPPPGGGKPKKSSSALSKSDQAFLTNSQALEKRSQSVDQ